jgi:hypothetical protein
MRVAGSSARVIVLTAVFVLMGGTVGAWASERSPSSPPAAGQPETTERAVDLLHPLQGPDVEPTDARSVALVDGIRDAGTNELVVGGLIATLATVGVPVVDLDDDQVIRPVDGPPSTMRLTIDQARAMAVEVRAGSGILAADLDAAIPVPEDLPAASEVIAAWVASADSPGGRLARALLAGQDVSEPADLLLPGLVLTLFVDDLTERGSASGARVAPSPAPGSPVSPLAMAVRGPADGRLVAPPQAVDDMCTRAVTFIDDVLTTAFDALKVTPPREGAGAVIVGLWNWLVDQGHTFVRGVVDELLGTIRPFLETVVGTVATISVALASFAPYAVSVTALLDAGGTTDLELPIAPAPPVTGRFLAAVQTGGIPDWPPVVRDCARRLSGIELPSLRPVGSEVRWQVSGPGAGFLELGEAERVLDERGAAGQPFRSVVQPPDVAEGDAAQSMVRVRVDVIRPGARQEMRSVLDSFLGRLGAPLQATIRTVLGTEMDALVERVGKLLDLRGDGWMTITYRVPPERPTPSPIAGMTVRQRFVNRFWREVKMEVDLRSCDAGRSWSGTFRYTTGPESWQTDDTVPMRFDFGDKARTTATMTVMMVLDSKDHSYVERSPSTFTITVRRKRGDGGVTSSLSFHAAGKADKGPYGFTHMAEDIPVTPSTAGGCATS